MDSGQNGKEFFDEEVKLYSTHYLIFGFSVSTMIAKYFFLIVKISTRFYNQKYIFAFLLTLWRYNK